MIEETRIIKVPMNIGSRRVRQEMKLEYDGGRIFLTYGYNKEFTDKTVKTMQGATWHGFENPPIKKWSILNTARNDFQLRALQFQAMDQSERQANPTLDPYYIFDRPLPVVSSDRGLRDYQLIVKQHILGRRCVIVAYEMGTGKTLAWIDAAEQILQEYRNNFDDNRIDEDLIWYVGPVAGVKSTGLELKKWNAKFKPLLMTYEGLTKRVKEWKSGDKPPLIVCFDESSKTKNHTAKRSEAAQHLADAIRDEYGMLGSVVLMTGTPNPKSPRDWWKQCEIAAPGFLKEGTPNKFEERLCIIEMKEGLLGQRFAQIKTWKDDPKKCNICGEFESHRVHKGQTSEAHDYKKSENEVANLYKRLQGLVIVGFKKDLTGLPEKQYEIIQVKPTPELLRAAHLIKAASQKAVTALVRIRELSDGFQYTTEATGTQTCVNCKGSKLVKILAPKEGVDPETNFDRNQWHEIETECDNCSGTGETITYSKTTDTVGSPKDQVVFDELDAHEDIGRYIIWAGFTGTIDRIVALVQTKKWAVLRIDGRGYFGMDKDGNTVDSDELLIAMDRSHPRFEELREKYPQICTIGHPEAGGMALTLTGAPCCLYYSNSFKGEARWQSEDRGHRLGMDENKGFTVKDIIMLPTDQLILSNLKNKRRLQDLSLGELERAMSEPLVERSE